MTMRSVTPAVAPVLERLELDQPVVVSRQDLDAARHATGSSTTTRYLIEELRTQGWLLALRTRGYWEFAPAARAGAIGAGDPHIELRAALRKWPDLPVALAAESAAWLLGLSARSPNRHAIAVPASFRVPPALGEYRVIRHAPRLDPQVSNGLPIWSVATLLAAMSHRPSGYRDWPNVADWLSQAVSEVRHEHLQVELVDAPRSTWMRLAYLIDQGGRPDLAAAITRAAPPGKGPYYLGPRSARGVHNNQYNVIDSTLSISPQ